MINNPCKWFVTGWDEEEFKYEGGRILYHFCPSDVPVLPELNRWIPINLVFFANNIEE